MTQTTPSIDGILIYFHCAPGTGYAIGRLEKVFRAMGQLLTGSASRVFFAYPTRASEGMDEGEAAGKVDLVMDPRTRDPVELARLEHDIRALGVNVAFGFDQQPGLPVYAALRRAGVRTIISYWGAPMSSLFSGARLLAKRLQVALYRNSPDHYVFESSAMRDTAVHGRGIAHRRTSVVPLGVDAGLFHPDEGSRYAQREFNLPDATRIVIYSGHMEARKGVHVLVQAAVRVCQEPDVADVCFLLLGDQPGESHAFDPLYRGTPAEPRILFGGYRKDIDHLMRCASVGVIASVGWDSFTRSAVEIAASGVPLVVSRLQGLSETVEDQQTGVLFEPGDVAALTRELLALLRDEPRRARMGKAARARVLAHYTETGQAQALATVVRQAHGQTSDTASIS